MTFDPPFKVLLVIFQLGTGRHSIRLDKMILGCKFHIWGIKTTLGQQDLLSRVTATGVLPKASRANEYDVLGLS